MHDDSHLLRAFVETRADSAFAELVQRHLGLVYRSALRQLNGDTHRAEDVAQLVFAALAQQAPQLMAHTSLPAWLYATTHRVTCQLLRSERRRQHREVAWATDPTNSSAAGTVAPSPAVTALLDEAMRSLAARDREPLLHRYFLNRSYAEIGQALQVAEDAARMRVSRALGKLRRELEKRGVALTTVALNDQLGAETAVNLPVNLTSTVTTAALQITPPAVTGILAALAGVGSATFGTAVLATTAALSTMVAIYQWTKQVEATAALAVATHHLARVEQPISATPSPVPIARPAAAVDPVRDPFEADRQQGEAFLKAHPEVRQALVEYELSQIRGKYLPLYRELGLTAAEIAAFENLRLGATGQPVPKHGIIFARPFLPVEERRERLKALLGASRYARIRDASIIGGEDELIQQVATRLTFTDDPLTPEGVRALRQSLGSRRAVAAADSDPGSITAAAHPALSPTQLKEWHAVLLQDRYRRALEAARQASVGQ